MSRSLQPLPILDSVGEVFRGLLRHIRYLPRLALLPFTLSFALILLKFLTESDPLRLLFNLADIFPVALFSFLWFRLLLYGPNPETLRPLPPFGEAFRRFVIYNLLLLAPLLVLQEMLPAPPPPGTEPAQVEAQAREQLGPMLLLMPLLFLYIVVMAGMSF
ncbi:MAG: hypothetical protein WD489_08430, partial [Rhodovibrionaceae bacterium]